MHKRDGSGLPDRSRLNLDPFGDSSRKGIFLATFHIEFYWIGSSNPIRNVAKKIQYETSPHDLYR